MEDDDYYTSGSEDDYYTSGSEEDYSCSDKETDVDDALENSDSDLPRKAPTCKVITKETLLAAQTEDLRRVIDLLSVREHHARTLLIHYQWNVDKLFGVYVDDGRERLFSQAGITLVADLDSQETASTLTCDICAEDVPGTDVTLMDCGHSFCNDCWSEYFIVKIKEGESKRIKCMAYKCNSICDESIVRKLVSTRHPDLADKFDRFILESYIEDNKKVKWCPSVPHCGNAIRVEDDESCEVECSCGFQFCFSCASEAHSPCPCMMWNMWKKKCEDESETVNWITVHTKPCPKCLKSVEKDGGCNLVVCKCGQAFCWLCGGATGRNHTWTSIDNHTCGRFKEDYERKAEHAKRNLNRYVHYHNRYKAHKDSFELESQLRQNIEEKAYNLEQKEWNLKNFDWVTKGIGRLFRSRRALSHSYAFAFYMFGDELFHGEMNEKEMETKKDLFEGPQQHLESNVEKLSRVLARPFNNLTEEEVIDARMQVIDLCVVIDDFSRKMYECIEELLGSLQSTSLSIAQYQPEGPGRAVELTDNSDG